MATLAAMLRKFDTGRPEPRRAEGARQNPYVLRALPNEDIFFHTKRVGLCGWPISIVPVTRQKTRAA